MLVLYSVTNFGYKSVILKIKLYAWYNIFLTILAKNLVAPIRGYQGQKYPRNIRNITHISVD